MSESTVARNTAPIEGGVNGTDDAVEATLVHATVALTTGGGGLAITNGAQSDVELYGSLLAGNLGGNCPSTAKPIDEQYNLDDANTCVLDDPTSKINTDPGLDEDLRDRGGHTDVIPFLNASSPAIDMVTFCGSGIDQRGYQRVVTFDQPCDAGAYEASAQGVPGPTIDSGPSGPTSDGSATFEFSTDDPTAEFVCRLSSGSSPGTFEDVHVTEDVLRPRTRATTSSRWRSPTSPASRRARSRSARSPSGRRHSRPRRGPRSQLPRRWRRRRRRRCRKRTRPAFPAAPC